jgi:two-component system nitrogen regulation sensor histidine kinase NtrY
VELEKKHHEVEGRRRYVETILDRIATGVVSVDAAGRVRTVNSAASRLLGIDESVLGRPAPAVFGSAELKPLGTLIENASRNRQEARPQEVAITQGGRELHLAVMTTPLRRDDGVSEGAVVVLDDVTPLIRAQKVAAWREVARRLAHEIKNPLTPIQRADARAGGGVHHHDRGRSRVAEGAGGRVLAVRADAGAAGDPDRAARVAQRRADAVYGYLF